MTRQDTNAIEAKEKRPRSRCIFVEFLAGTDLKEAVNEMVRLHHETGADVETKFNDLRIIVADNAMFERFGYKGKR